LKDQHLRAEEKAYFKLPRASIGTQSLLPGQSPVRTNAPPGELEINAELLAVQLPTTNNPSRSVTALSNVVITSSADQNRATADQARYFEATGILELNGRAVWQSGERIVSGDTLFVDRTNRLFSVTSNAFLRLPLAELGKQALLSPLGAGRTNSATTTNAPQYIELWCNDFDYRGTALTFRHKIRAHFLEDTNALGSLHCGVLQFLFNSNQVERVTAKDAVHLEQFPYTSTNGTTITKSLDCELINVLLATNGWITRLIAETNVNAVQVERSKTNAAPVASTLTAQLVIGEFFTHTNRLRELIALKEVTLGHDQRKAFGERAVYNVTNNLVELTGNPRAHLPPQGEITDAEVLTYDVARKTFSVHKGIARGERPASEGRALSGPSTNQSNLPFIK
jgi:lipopolysaccharide export system protein LptA